MTEDLPDELQQALALLTAVEALEAEALAHPVDYVPWLPPQIAFLSHDEKKPALLRLGNRQGKSTAGGAELVFYARGVHPFKQVKQAPTRSALVCMNMIQSIEIQRVVWDLLGGVNNTELVDGTEFSSRTGFKGHRPVIQFRNGSEIHVYSNAQGAGTLAGSEFDGVIVLDEPPSREVYNEALSRVRNTAGRVVITLTPINGPPLPWLQEMTVKGEDGSAPKVTDYHYPLTAENCISPMTGITRKTKDGIPWDADFIAALESQVDPITRDIRLHGAWERAYEGQYYTCWDPKRHSTENIPGGFDQLFLGTDYASSLREMGMCASFIGVKFEDLAGERVPHVYVIDEVVMSGHDTMAMFSARVLKMLQGHGVKWSDLDGAYGDKPASSKHGTSGNLQFAKQVARGQQMVLQALRPKITSVKEGRGSSGPGRFVYDHRLQWMYSLIANDRLRVHPRCAHTLKGFLEFDGSPKHPSKDIMDGLGYACFDLWKMTRGSGILPRVMFS